MFAVARRSRHATLSLVGTLFGSLLMGGTAEASAPRVPTAARAAAVAAASVTATVTGIRQSKVIGYSRQHRPIVAYEMGNPAAPFKALVLGSMHGYYERAGEQVVAAIKKSAVPKNIDLWVIPTINPDGDVLHQRGNAAGVDLNRNFPFRWTYIAPTSSKFDSHYSGPSPLSEPESRAMYNFLGALKPNRVVSMHQPLDAVDMTDGGARDIPFRDALARNLSLPKSPLVCWGVCHGSMTGWLTNTQRGAAITVEFTQNPSTSYLTGTAAHGIIAALGVNVKPYVPQAVRAYIDPLDASTKGLRISGWAYDPAYPAAAGSIAVTVYGKSVHTAIANAARSDVNKKYHLTGGHGFWMNLVMAKGRHTVCVSARPAAGSDSTPKAVLACRAVTMPAPLMQGHATASAPTAAGAVHITGWTVDPLHPTAASPVRFLVDGKVVRTVTTSVLRGDANAVMHTTGRHGFDVTLTLKPGRHGIRVIAPGGGAIGPSPIGIQTVVVPG